MNDKLYRALLSLELGWVLGSCTAAWALPAALAERGYWAIGGEWLLILAAAAVGGWIGWGIIRPRKKKGGRFTSLKNK